jgi:hypothetical protein
VVVVVLVVVLLVVDAGERLAFSGRLCAAQLGAPDAVMSTS